MTSHSEASERLYGVIFTKASKINHVTDQLMKFMLIIEKNIYYDARKYNITASNAKVLRQKRRKRSLEETLHVVM
jgi:hypothetical protein